jgi:3-hydroxyacyl-CoA dehydrogenase/enoyl-CoA hydratase/3-hydroxybutyryl-CoA epimerase
MADPGTSDDPVRIEITGAVAVLTFDVPGRPQNLLNAHSIGILETLVARIASTAGLLGAVVVSGKRDFIAGGDLDAIGGERDARKTFETTYRLSCLFRRIERSAIPYVAALNGSALGGGFELALACHRRVVADVPGLQIGLPEARVGLMPGAGGTQRLPRMIGVPKALPLLMTGASLSPAQALELGLVDEIVPPAELFARALAVAAESSTRGGFGKAWDRPDFRLPSGDIQDEANRRFFLEASAQSDARTRGNSPAERCILAAVQEGCGTGIDAALEIEARKFTEVASSPEARAIIRTGFFAKRRLRKAAAPAAGTPPVAAVIGVVGLGLMGAAIACTAASRGFRVLVLDRDAESTAAGHARALALARRSTARSDGADAAVAAAVDAVASRLVAVACAEDLAGCDVVIEAVPEYRTLKARILTTIEAAVGPRTLIASNTSSIPISRLAESLQRPERFIGMHFFSPVERMELLEIVPGRQTDEATRARALALACALGKTPVIARDVRGFYTGRVFAPYLAESFAMIAEGWSPALIEEGARRLGMPIGPLALTDAVSLDLQQQLRRQEEADGEGTRRLPAADRVVDLFVDTLNRRGRAAGAGFYDYGEGGRSLWGGYAEHFGHADPQPDIGEVIDRLLYIQVLDGLRCLHEGIVASPDEVDVGAVLGWGFPLHLGGPCWFADTRGLQAVADTARVLAARYGERFSPPKGLLRLAAENRAYHGAAAR